MGSTQKRDVFRVIPKLAVTYQSGESRCEAIVTMICHPFDRFESRGQLPPGFSDCLFSINFSHLPLVYGRCKVHSPSRDQLIATDIALDPQLAQIPLDRRIGPFVAFEDRPAYRECCAATSPPFAEREPGLGQLYQLVSLIGEINSAQQTDVLLFKIIDAAGQIMEAQAASLMITDHRTGELVVAVPTGPARAEISGIRIPPGEGIAGWVAQRGEPLAVANVSEDPRFFGEISGHSFHTSDLVAVPLHAPDGRTIGVLEAINKNGPMRFSDEDIPLLAVLADHAALALERERLTRASIDQQLLEQELALAGQIQEGFWPRTVPELEGFEMAGMSLAARHVGGDYYDFIVLDEDRLAVVVADVSGKGVAAALVMSALRSSLRAHLKLDTSMADAVAEVNTTISEDTPPNRFITLFLALLDRRQKNISYVNAGHNAPFLVDPSGKMSRLEEGGPVLGFRAGLPYSVGTAEMLPGAALVLFSDGVSEAQNADEEFFGEDRLLETLMLFRSHPARELLTALNSQIKEHVEDSPQYDDLTLVVVKSQ